MKTKVALVIILALGIASAAFIHFHSRKHPHTGELGQTDSQATLETSPAIPGAAGSSSSPSESPIANSNTKPPLAPFSAATSTNKLERLRQIETRFRSLAAGDPLTALRAAKEMTNSPVERERALLTLATEWTHGELRPPALRAHAIDGLGIEAGIGLEVAGNPQLAVLWANELTEGEGRNVLLQSTANRLVTSDPSAAFALAEQVPEADRRKFYESIFAVWGGTDTDAALKWADQLPDATDRDAAVAAIRTQAPVGIGTALKMEDGYPVITQVLAGTAAEKSGQIRPGDRIVGVAQGDSRFVDVRGVPLEQIVIQLRGAPNTMLQIQVVSADAPENSIPRTVTIFRDQIKFKTQTQ